MRSDQFLKQIGDAARQDRPPKVDVTEKVMLRLESEFAEKEHAFSHTWISVFASGMIAYGLFVLFNMFSVLNDPLVNLLFID